MIVYVETNFVLELAFQQEEHASCADIVTLARENRITIHVPAFSLMEPYVALAGRAVHRQRALNELAQPVRELGRSAPYAEAATRFRGMLNLLLTQSSREERTRIRATKEMLLQAAHPIGLSQEILLSASEIEKRHNLSPQDSVVYASIRSHRDRHRPAKSVFLNRNSKDFDVPALREDLTALGCKLVLSFRQGLDFIHHTLRQN